MNSRRAEVIHLGSWTGLGELYNVYTGKGYTTIVVRKNERLREKVRLTRAKFGYTPAQKSSMNR